MINSWQLRRRRRCRNPKQRSFFFFFFLLLRHPRRQNAAVVHIVLLRAGTYVKIVAHLGLPIPFGYLRQCVLDADWRYPETSQHRKAGLLLSSAAANRMQSLKELETNLATYNEQLHQVSLLLHLNALPPSAPSWFSEGIRLQVASVIPFFFRLFFVLDGIGGLCGLAPM